MLASFRPSFIATVAVLLLLPVLLALGFWQLQRAAEKRALQHEYDARAIEEPVTLAPYLQEAADLRFRRVRVRGQYDPHYQLLLDNRIYRGRPGYHVLTPLRIDGSEVRVLINRGWIALGESRAQLPSFDTPSGPLELIGVATVPSDRHFMLGTPAPLTPEVPTVWQQLDLARYRAAVPFKVQPVVLLLEPASAGGGLIRDWPRLDAGIAVHQGYAFQWFVLAAALLALYLYHGRRRASAPAQPPDTLTS